VYSLLFPSTWALEVAKIDCLETTRNTYKSTQDNVLEGRTPQPVVTSIEESSAVMVIVIEEHHRTQDTQVFI
jgi:hypothetical protein